MYDLLQQYALDRVSDAERERVFKTLQAYYNQRVDQARDGIAELYRPLAEPALAEPAQVIVARARLQDALVEDLHYRLRWNPAQGFQTYFRYAEEAIATRDDSLDMQLRAELLGFLSECDPSGRAEEIDGLRRADVVADAAVRWIKRLTNDGKYDKALEVAERLCTDARGLIVGGGDLAEAELRAWKALVLTYTGSYDEAQQLLDLTEEQLEVAGFPPEQAYRWSAILARTYNNLGYLGRVLGQFKGPEEAYTQALRYWKYAKIEAEYANTLNNLAFVLALTGHFDAARENVKKALDIRGRLGPRGPVAFAYGTWAEIETYAGEYQDAEKYALKALDIWRKLRFRRGEGLVLLTNAAIHRFQIENLELAAQEEPAAQEERKDLLRMSLSDSREALKIFSEEVEEREREIRAYYERGTTYRELCRFSEPGMEREKYAENAREDLERARSLSRKDELWWVYLDASIGLAWMYYYSEATEELDRLLQDLEQDFQRHFEGYRITQGKVYEEKDSIVLNRFGRLHVLRGMQAMDRFKRSARQPPYPHLRKAAREFTFALEYNALIGENHQGVRRSMYNIHNRVKALDIYERKVFYDGVAEAAEELGLPREECHLWRELGDIIEPYEILTRLVH
jgi:tetratricopeptide (TPR) repeat protein